MVDVGAEDLKDFAQKFEDVRQKEKLKLYVPFGEDDIHFDSRHQHDCEYKHSIDLSNIRNPDTDDLFVADTQVDFHASQSRSRWAFCANRGGKTMPGAAEAALYALGPDGEPFWDGMPDVAVEKYKNIDVPNQGWVVSRSHEVQDESTQDWLIDKGILPQEFIEKTWIKHEDKLAKILLTNGSEITFKSTDAEREAFQGAAKRWIWFDEEPKSEEIYDECLARRSGSYPLDIWGTMTPVNGMSFLRKRIVEKPENHDIFQWSLWDNPYFGNDEVQQLEDGYAEEDAKVRIYGMFTEATGLIYPQFSDDTHVRETFDIPGDWTIFEAIDPGFINEAAVLYWAVSPTGMHHIVDEIYESGLNIPELCQEIKKKRENPTCSETERWRPQLSVADPQVNETNGQTKRTDRRVMASDHPEDGPPIRVKPAKKSGTGIRSIRNWLDPGAKDATGTQFVVLEHCNNFIYEMEHYRKKQLSSRAQTRRNDYEKPQKKDDHLMNCAKYIANENPRHISEGGSSSYKERKKNKSSQGTSRSQRIKERKRKNAYS